MTRFLRARGTPAWLALYTLGMLAVVFFVLFEVLDLDGSEFNHGPSHLSIKLAEAGHEDVRRISLLGAGTLAAPVVSVAAAPPPPTLARRPAPARHVTVPLARTSRAALARALLSDVPPSA